MDYGSVPMSKMLEETRQQPTALSRTLGEALASLGELRSRLERKRPRLVILVARGTSDNAAQFGRYLIEITTGIPVSLAAPSVTTLYRCPLELDDVLVVGISQSGESTDTNAVLEDARSRGAATVGITNERASPMAGIAEHVLLARADKEESVAATKTYTCELMAFYLLAYALGGNVDARMLQRIPDWVERVLELEDSIAEIAERYTFMLRAVTVGRGLNYSNALELGLKLMETCYVVTERFSAADLMHGPIDMVKDLKAETLVFTDEANASACAKPARLIRLPIRCDAPEGPADLYTPIPYILPAQLFAAHLAWIKGLNPDRPRALHKITITM